MTEHDTTGDPELADRLRTGLDALAEQVGDPPPFPAADRAGSVPAHPRRGRAYAVAAVLVLLVAVAGVAVWSQRDSSPDERVGSGPETSTTVAGPDRPLVGTRWWLEDAASADGAVEVDRMDIGLQITEQSPCEGYTGGTCEPGTYLSASDACNGITRHVEVGADRLVLGELSGGSTAMACGGPLVELLGQVFSAGPVPYEISGDQLKVTRDGAELTYRATDGPFAPTAGAVVDEGAIGPASYRVVWEDGGLSFQKADTKHDLARGGAGVGDDPGRINPMRDSVQGRPYLFAVVPKDAVRVVYEPEGGGDPQELPIHRVDSDTSSVVASFVDDDAPTWQLVAYDADGIELHRYRWGSRSDYGAGLSIEEMVPKAGLQGCCKADGARERFTAEGVPMSIGSAPAPPGAPRDPAEGLTDPERIAVPGGGEALIGTIRDQAAIRFACAETRYEIQAPTASADALPDVAARLSTAAGCPVAAIAG